MKVERKKMGKGAICCALAKKEGSGRRRIVFELLEIAVFDLLHEGFALEEIALEVGGELARHDEELVVCHFGKRDWATRWNEMRTPLEDKAAVPESEGGEKCDCCSEGDALWKLSDAELVSQGIAEMEKLYTKDRMREIKEAIAQMEKNRPENEARLREAQAQMALMEKLYQNDERGGMIHGVEPKYSEDARDKKIEGTVLLTATIDPNGVPQDIQVTKPLFPSLDANAVEALRQSRFRPYMKDGQPISKRITVEMHFAVNDWQQDKQKEREREQQEKEKAEDSAKLKDKVFEMRMRKDRVESGREERSRKQVEMTRGATISMDRAIQVATSQYPGKVLACSLGREQDGQVFYHLVMINIEGEKSTTRYVWISATDGHIIKTEWKAAETTAGSGSRY